MRKNGYTDMELCGEFYVKWLFLLLDVQYPESCFAYNTRDVSRWVGLTHESLQGKVSPCVLGSDASSL